VIPVAERLSPRELALFELMTTTHMTEKEIGALFGRSTKTVNNQVRNMYAKLGIESRVELIIKYWKCPTCGRAKCQLPV
jgi:DNA-binding CsgD family transcriptional regulator